MTSLRCKDAWELVNNKIENSFKSLETVMDPTGNFKNYRMIVNEAIKSSGSSTFVPIMSIFMKDFLFFDEGNPKYLPSTNANKEAQMVNWDRLVIMNKKAHELLCCQRAKYYVAVDRTTIDAVDSILSTIININPPN